MLVKRTAELSLLTKQYESSESNIVILYGRKGIGKTALLSEFLEDKPAYYYACVECDCGLQLERINRQFRTDLEKTLDYPLLFSAVIKQQQRKAVIVLDEFHFILKNSPSFLDAFRLLKNSEQPVMLILCSSSIRFVENEMVNCLGSTAFYITAYLKLKEFSFIQFVNRFPKSSVETCIYINAILGGVPDYLTEWQEELSVRDNIITALLNKDSRLFYEPQQFLKQELREPAVYNTILSFLAQGNRKLNDLHKLTGYSRAKIIVYLKNLEELDIVEKFVPFEDEGKENAKKGLYRITDHYLSFWYRFIFPNLSELLLCRSEEVYEEKINPYLNDYMGEYFSDVCLEYLKLMNQYNRLPVNYIWWDRWYGKRGTIDIVAKGKKNETLTGKCIWEDRVLTIEDYNKLTELSAEAGLNSESLYLFSKKGFSEKLKKTAKQNATIHLVGLEDL